MGISVPTLFALMHGDQIPTDETLGKICRGLDLPKDEQDELVRLATLERAKSVTRVFLREIYAHVDEKKAEKRSRAEPGVPVFNLEVASERGNDFYLGLPEGTISVPGLDESHAMACLLHGDSMEPSFKDGDILVFNSGADPHSGDVCLVVAKRFTMAGKVFLDDDEVRLVPINQLYPEHRMPRNEIEQMWRLQGAFSWCGGA